MKTLQDGFKVGDNVGFQRRGRQNAAGFMKTRGRRSWFPKWETRLVQRVGDKAGQRLVKNKINF